MNKLLIIVCLLSASFSTKAMIKLSRVFHKISITKIYIFFISLAGNMIIDFRRLNTPSTAMPSNLKGSMTNHTMGYNTNAKIASGQQNINRTIQAMNGIIC